VKRLLLVDDHAMVRKGLVSILSVLQEDGMLLSCDEAGSGEDALGLLKQYRYDLVVLDIAMPELGGLELLSIIHENWPTLPVLMLSMFPEEQFALRLLKAGSFGVSDQKGGC
jgi:Response regulator containing a CheY-like receiver domain and an HTH DNA-binding domain